MFACRSLINSPISEEVDWILLDTTADSNIPGPVYIRAWKATKRVFVFCYLLLTKKVDSILIFCGDGLSFVEKGLMAMIGKSIGKKVIIAPRSGFIERDVRDSAFMRRYIPFVLTHVDYVICQGPKWKTFFNEKCKVPEQQLTVIQNWVDAENYSGGPGHNKVPVILFMAWVDRNKGIFDLLKACITLSDQGKNFTFFIAGKGTALHEVEKLLLAHPRLNERTQLLGWMKGEDKRALLRKSDIFVLPSYYEGFPNSLLEAMASGLACVSSNVGSVQDLIEDSINGLMFPAGDIEKLTEQLSMLIDNQNIRVDLGHNAIDSVRKNNNLATSWKKILELL